MNATQKPDQPFNFINCKIGNKYSTEELRKCSLEWLYKKNDVCAKTNATVAKKKLYSYCIFSEIMREFEYVFVYWIDLENLQ